MRVSSRFVPMGLAVLALASSAQATDFAVTPSIIDLQSATASIEGTSLRSLSVGDEFTLAYTVENRDADVIGAVFTTLAFDPSVLLPIATHAEAILIEEPGGFGAPLLVPIIAPEPVVFTPPGFYIGMSHVPPVPAPGADLVSTRGRGPDLAFAIAFRVLSTQASTIRHGLSFPPEHGAPLIQINGQTFCASASIYPGCTVIDPATDPRFSFPDFALTSEPTAAPEPTTATLLGLGLALLARCRRRPAIV